MTEWIAVCLSAGFMTLALTLAIFGRHALRESSACLRDAERDLDEARQFMLDLGDDAPRRWINPSDALPPIGLRVEVWMIEDRLRMEDEQPSAEIPAYGYFTGTHWVVEGDPLALVLWWREAAEGPAS